jgi:hypothetical protein
MQQDTLQDGKTDWFAASKDTKDRMVATFLRQGLVCSLQIITLLTHPGVQVE